jgi:hypothetical protein
MKDDQSVSVKEWRRVHSKEFASYNWEVGIKK